MHGEAGTSCKLVLHAIDECKVSQLQDRRMNDYILSTGFMSDYVRKGELLLYGDTMERLA